MATLSAVSAPAPLVNALSPSAVSRPKRLAGSSSRLASLDALRGITIAAMLIVNHPGKEAAAYAPLRHAEWHGWTATDLIFPFFLFVMGAALPLSLEKQRENGVHSHKILIRAATRALILISLGLLLASFPWWHMRLSTLRLPGVLQRIGLTYIMAVLVIRYLRGRGQLILTVALLLGYWALLSWVPVPRVGAGVWEPGKDVGAFVDRAVFGSNHLMANEWDPEGLLSTLPALATVMFGALVIQWLQSRQGGGRACLYMALVGIAAVTLGQIWGIVFPINKNLWTSSFALFSAGAAAIALASCYWLVDVQGYRRWAYPFLILGVNSIAAYVLSELADSALWRIHFEPLGIRSLRMGIYGHLFEAWLPPSAASLGFAATFAFTWICIMGAMYKRKIRLSI